MHILFWYKQVYYLLIDLSPFSRFHYNCLFKVDNCSYLSFSLTASAISPRSSVLNIILRMSFWSGAFLFWSKIKQKTKQNNKASGFPWPVEWDLGVLQKYSHCGPSSPFQVHPVTFWPPIPNSSHMEQLEDVYDRSYYIQRLRADCYRPNLGCRIFAIFLKAKRFHVKICLSGFSQ